MKALVKKARLDLIPARVLRFVAKAFEYGEQFYARWNWRLGDNCYSTYYGAAKRHMDKWYECEGKGFRGSYDEESGVHHIDCAIASLMILRDLTLMREGAVGVDTSIDDDRPKFMVERLREQKEDN